MKFLLLALVSLGLLSACSLTRDAAEPSWTDAQLSESPPGAAPAFIERAVMERSERRMLDAHLEETLQARDAVNTAGAALRGPTLDTAEFVVEARRRATPPPPQ
ncbi:MAG: hypothetical protein RIA71_09740 [Oceanicaulis sp.]